AAGGMLEGLLSALQARERRRAELEAERAMLRAQTGRPTRQRGNVRDELLTLAESWRRVLAEDPTNARPIVSSLLKGRVIFTPLQKPKWWQLRGEGTLIGLFTREIFPSVWRPQRDSNPCFGLERAAGAQRHHADFRQVHDMPPLTLLTYIPAHLKKS